MQPSNFTHVLNSLTFYKSASEIKEKIDVKILTVQAKIEERQKRVSDLRKEYSIDDQALIQLLTEARQSQREQKMSYSYSTSNLQVGATAGLREERTIGAGVVNNLLTENDFIASEKSQVNRLQLISRNIKSVARYASNGTALPDEGFVLTEEDLKYLGF